MPDRLIKSIVSDELERHKETVEKVISVLQGDIQLACETITQAVLSGHKVLLAGNGGSAADAQHIAAEFTGRFVKERKALPAVALNTDTSAITSIGNDYGFDLIFSRQIEALANPGDVFIAISTSGNSKNILLALAAAKQMGCKTIALSGKGGGQITGRCDLNIIVPAVVTARIQEMHILIGHIFCSAVDELF